MSRIFTTTALAALLGAPAASASSAQQTANPPAITAARARALALAAVPRQQGVVSEKLKTKDGIRVYELDIEIPGPGHQEVRVDAETGVVVASKHEDDVAGTVWRRAGEAAGRVGDAAKDAADAAAREADRVFSDEEIVRLRPTISEVRARAIAQERVPGAPVKDVDLETENGVLVWEIDLDTAGPGHEEVLVDAVTGKVLRAGHEL